jgi:hypothetical protein
VQQYLCLRSASVAPVLLLLLMFVLGGLRLAAVQALTGSLKGGLAMMCCQHRTLWCNKSQQWLMTFDLKLALTLRRP